MSSIAERARNLLNTEYYSMPNLPERVGTAALRSPEDRQYVLRCPIAIPGHDINLPGEMEWCGELIDESLRYQRDVVGVSQPYTYLTIRHGEVTSQTDDAFHVDGFSMKVPHIPEQNYVWTNTNPTEAAELAIDVPDDFDPLKYNIQYLIQDSISDDTPIHTLDSHTIYAMDPYMPHRRPAISNGTVRTFIRLSMTPIPIDDVNNHVNPAFGQITSSYDGVVDFRDKLERYPL